VGDAAGSGPAPYGSERTLPAVELLQNWSESLDAGDGVRRVDDLDMANPFPREAPLHVSPAGELPCISPSTMG
jgi:hypothetical protein